MRTPVAIATLLVLPALASAGPADEAHIAVRPGEALRVIDAGIGEPVVLIPGILGSAFAFRDLIRPLSGAGYRVIVIEPLGTGGSSKPERADYSLSAQADRLACVLEALRAEPAVVVAHAVGASIALRLACRHPERVKAVVSLDGGPAEAAATPGFRRAMRFAPLLRLFGGVGRIRGKVRATLIERSADPRWVTDEVVEGYMGGASRDLDGALRAYRQIAKAREPEQLLPRLTEIRCPVRLVIGTATREGGISDAEVRLLQERLPFFAIDRVADAGHFVFEEKPAAVVAAVERVLASAGLQMEAAVR